MKYFVTVCMACLLITGSVYSQEKNTTHRVEKGETIAQIAQKYKVTPLAIYQLNPDAQSGLKPNSVLLIPKISFSKNAAVSARVSVSAKTHVVIAKETLYGIEKKYGVSDEALKNANPFLEKDGLQIGQTLVIPNSIASKTSSVSVKPSSIVPRVVAQKAETLLYHEVLPKETKYSIAKKYGISIVELEKKNPEIITNLPVGYRLIIKGSASKALNPSVVESKKDEVKAIAVQDSDKINYIDYEVKPKETLYGIAKETGFTQERLIAINPSLSSGVIEGMILKIPSKSIVVSDTQKTIKTLLKSTSSTQRKKLVLLLPFNIEKEGDTINSAVARLKGDKFLNMTVDFYTGAMFAIDSARQLRLPVDIRVFDSQENKNGSSVAAIIKENDLEDADAIIGPFYQSNVENTAKLLAVNQVPVLSPLSKDDAKTYSNIYQTIPSSNEIKNAMFNFMKAKNGNILAVVDRKKESILQYLQDFQKETKLVPLNSNGSLSADNLKRMFVKEKLNYVVMETGNTAMIKATVATMLSAMSSYKVQLVILEPNETLDTDEISYSNLTKLKMMYPSVNRENESTNIVEFEKKYKKVNNIAPNIFATRGFDITFDTLMRLSQGKSFQESADETATEQSSNKFEYYKKPDGGYVNKGVYIMYYDTDLTIKQAN